MTLTAKAAFAEGQYPVALKADMQRITDLFTGADGGIDFVRFRFAMEDFAERAATDDAAFQFVRVVRVFAALVEGVTRPPPRG